MFDKDAALALLPQLTSRWKIIANISYDNHSLHTDVERLWFGCLHSSQVEITVWEDACIRHAVLMDSDHILPYLPQNVQSTSSSVQGSIPEKNENLGLL